MVSATRSQTEVGKHDGNGSYKGWSQRKGPRSNADLESPHLGSKFHSLSKKRGGGGAELLKIPGLEQVKCKVNLGYQAVLNTQETVN